MRADRAKSGVGFREGARERAERVVYVVFGGAHQGNRLLDPHGPRRDSARLVQAEHVHAGERLDAGELLYQGAAHAEAHDAHRQRHAGQKDQPLGDHPDKARDRAHHGVLQRHPAQKELAEEEQHAQRHDDVADRADDAVERGDELGIGFFEIARLPRDARRVAVLAHGDHPRASAPGDDEAARVQCVPRPLVHRVRLAGQ